MNETGHNPTPQIFMCHYGLGRSKAGARAAEAAGIASTFFSGGTQEVARMSPKELKQKIPKGAKLYLIYDQGRPEPNEYLDKEAAITKLDEANIPYTMIYSVQLGIMCNNLGLDLDNFI